MDSVPPGVKVSQNQTPVSSIPSIVEEWCRNSEPIEADIAEVYAINFAVPPVSSKLIPHPDEIVAVSTEDGHSQSSEDCLLSSD